MESVSTVQTTSEFCSSLLITQNQIRRPKFPNKRRATIVQSQLSEYVIVCTLVTPTTLLGPRFNASFIPLSALPQVANCI